MKKITYLTYLIIFLIFQTSNFTLYAVNHSNKTESKHECHSFANGLTEANSQQVFICTGQYAYAYHSSATCPGLNNCKGEIKSTDEYSALNSYGRRPCCRCWTNISGNCKDDNPYNAGTSGGGSADNSEAYV